jgi:hypothetical protein
MLLKEEDKLTEPVRVDRGYTHHVFCLVSCAPTENLSRESLRLEVRTTVHVSLGHFELKASAYIHDRPRNQACTQDHRVHW